MVTVLRDVTETRRWLEREDVQRETSRGNQDWWTGSSSPASSLDKQNNTTGGGPRWSVSREETTNHSQIVSPEDHQILSSLIICVSINFRLITAKLHKSASNGRILWTRHVLYSSNKIKLFIFTTNIVEVGEFEGKANSVWTIESIESIPHSLYVSLSN